MQRGLTFESIVEDFIRDMGSEEKARQRLREYLDDKAGGKSILRGIAAKLPKKKSNS